MLFNSLQFALFLPAVVLLFWLSPQRFRPGILLVASYVFYMSWRPAFVLLILGLTIINYVAGNLIHNSQHHKKAWLAASVVINLSTLGFFKYAYFLDNLASHLLKPVGLLVPKIPFDIVLPLGISFFVFEFIHYLTDIYRGSQPVRSLTGFALFAAFFPTQIAGPIKRYQDFTCQFSETSRFLLKNFDQGVALILQGLFKKVLIADNLALFVQGGFWQTSLFHGLDFWLFTYAFAFQIYFDFSGYTDIARGSALLFGYKVPVNFNLPYLARNISEFWHRWHISLSTWLRDYLFIPLGGSRASRLMVYRNLLLTMTLGGLWHGAAGHFVIWGIYHGMLLIAHREFQRLTRGITWIERALMSVPGRVISTLITFHLVCIGWVLFRADHLQTAWEILSKMLFLDALTQGSRVFAMGLAGINYPLIYPSIYILLPLLAASHILMHWADRSKLPQRAPVFIKAAYLSALMFSIIVFSPDTSPRFIYFQF